MFGIKLFSENTFILICEIILGILPIAGLIQDVKDSILEPMKFFRVFAAIMIPLDITEIFGNVLAQVFGGLKDYCAGKGIGKVLGGIKKFIKNVYNKITKKLKPIVSKFLKVAKNAAIFFLALLTIVTIILIPVSAIAIIGLAVVFTLIVAFVSFLITSMRFVATKIMKPLYDSMVRGMSWVTNKAGNAMKKVFNAADRKTRGLLSKLKDIVKELFAKIWQGMKKLYEIGSWKPWKNTRMPWCVACFSTFAKKNLHKPFEVIKENDILWTQIKNLTPSQWDAIKNGAEFGFPEDILKKAAIEECATLISPGKTVDELFGEGGEFYTDSTRWQHAMSVFHSSYKNTLGDEVAKTAIKENLWELRKQLRNEEGNNNFIDLAMAKISPGAYIDDIVNDPDVLTEIFKEKENFDKLWKFYKEEASLRLSKLDSDIAKFTDELTDLEAQAYARCMLVLAGADDSIMSIHGGAMSHVHLAEPFQNAWRKLRATEDELRQAWEGQNIGEVYCKGLVHTGTHKGFDDVFLAWDNTEEKWIFRAIEQKTNSYKSIYLSTNLEKNTKATEKIVLDILDSANEFKNKLLVAGMDEIEAEKIINSLIERGTHSANAIGIDFLRKVNSGNLLEALKLAEPALDDTLINEILEASIKQNQIISLIEHGSTYKMTLENGFWTTATKYSDDITDNIELRYIPSGGGESVEIIFDSSVFKADFDVIDGKKYLKKPQFPGPNIDWDSLTDLQRNAYIELNDKITDALNGFDYCIEDLPAHQVAGRLNEMQTLIYNELICSKVFEELQIFSGGTMSFGIEIFSTPSQGSNIYSYLESFFDQNGIVSYNYHQQWDAPFSNKLATLFGGIVEESDKSRAFKERWFKMLLEESNYDVNGKTLGEIEELIHNNPDIAETLIRNFQDPFRLPDGHFWQESTSGEINKCLVFFDKKTGKEMELLSDGGQKYHVYMNYNLKHMLDDLGLDKRLLQNPISFSISDNGRFIVDFNPVAGSQRAGYGVEVAETWINHLRNRYGIPDDTLNLLNGRIGYGTGLDLFHPSGDDEMMKLFALILADYQRNCDDAMQYLRSRISLYPDGINFGTIQANNRISRIDIDWNGNMQIDGVEVNIRLGQPGSGGRGWESGRGVYSLGDGGNWLSKLINEIKIEALNLVFSFPEKPKVQDFFKWITTNWHFLN